MHRVTRESWAGTRGALWVIAGGAWGLLAIVAPACSAMLLVTLAILFLCWRWIPEPHRRFLIPVLAVSMAMRAACSIIVNGLLGIGSLAQDSYGSSLMSWNLAQTWRGVYESLAAAYSYDPYQFYGYNGYIGVIAVVYYLFGFSPIGASLVTALLGALTLIPVYFLARRLGGEPAARLSTLLVALTPSLILWSVTFLKETPTLFLLMLLLWVLVCWCQERALWALAGLPIVFFGFLMLRPHYIQITIALVLLGLAVWWLTATRKRFWTVAATTGIASLIALAVAHQELVQQFVVAIVSSIVGRQQKFIDVGGDTYQIYAPNVISNGGVNWMAFLAGVARGLVHFLTEPLPWHAHSLRGWLSVPQQLVWYALLPFCAAGFWMMRNAPGRAALPVFSVVGGMTLLYAMTEGNGGTAFRHRDSLTAVYLIAVSIGLCRFAAWVRRAPANGKQP